MTAESAQHTTPEARSWIGHALLCQDGCTIRDGGRVMCPTGADLYRAMLPDVKLAPIVEPATRPSAEAETRDLPKPASASAQPDGAVCPTCACCTIREGACIGGCGPTGDHRQARADGAAPKRQRRRRARVVGAE